jgi:membrane protein implicated in regulation of membrane protease activity
VRARRLVGYTDSVSTLSTTARILLALATAAAVVGGLLVALTEGTAWAIGIVLIAVSLTLLTSLAFLFVGESEDRYRRRHPRG